MRLFNNYPWLPVALVVLAVYYLYVIFFYKKTSKQEMLEVIKENNEQKKLDNISEEKEKKVDNLQKNKKISSYAVTTFLINVGAIFLGIKYNSSFALITIIVSIFLAATNFEGKGKEIIKGLLPVLIPSIIFVIYMFFIIANMKGL
jgi:Na+/H+ antiporter NhaD/arsenite permease-like protein